MKPVKTRIPADVLAVLARATITGNVLVLPEQLDRETYLRVAKTLTAARGKWDRKARGHVFPFDPRELMADAVETGTVVDARKTLQFFETPDELAGRMAKLAQIAPGNRVLEPSAGFGRILRHLLAHEAEVDAVEIDETNCETLRKMQPAFPELKSVTREDFQTFHDTVASRFDAVVMNPPFSNNLDIGHIRLAWDMLIPGGRLVAICSEGPFFRSDKAAVAFREWLDEIDACSEKLPPGTFRESGTDVATRLIVATAPGTRPEQAREPDTEATAIERADRSAACSEVRCLGARPSMRERRRAFEAELPPARSFFDLFFELPGFPFFVPFGKVFDARALGDRFEEFVGHVTRALLALVPVKELDEGPAFALSPAARALRPPGSIRAR